jgi:16S rRNA (guanine(527)-N(7))-methyltransferase RsmG
VVLRTPNAERPATSDQGPGTSNERRATESNLDNLQSVRVPMDTARISALLAPYLDHELSAAQLKDISTYIDILLKWNARMNLTAIRNPEEIVPRHFGESLFLARHVFPEMRSPGVPDQDPPTSVPFYAIDLGSGAGFPGLPLKIWAPQIHLTLVESNQKKATFLREVARTLTLTNVNVFAGRAETLLLPDKSRSREREFPGSAVREKPRTLGSPQTTSADLVTFRAIEKFDDVLPLAVALMSSSGCLAVLIGSSQLPKLHVLRNLTWEDHKLPQSESRLLAIGHRIDISGK